MQKKDSRKKVGTHGEMCVHKKKLISLFYAYAPHGALDERSVEVAFGIDIPAVELRVSEAIAPQRLLCNGVDCNYNSMKRAKKDYAF